MNVKYFLLASLSAFVFIFIFEFLWHGLLMQSLYMQTNFVWRPDASMLANMPITALVQIATAFILAFIFTRHYEAKGIGEGVRFGTYMGLLMGVLMVGFYPHLPIPAIIAVLWFIGSLIKGIGIGTVLAKIYRSE